MANIIFWRSKDRNIRDREIQIIDEYLSGLSAIEISRKYDIANSSLMYFLQKNKVPLRTQKEARNLESYNRKRNETIFIKYTPEEVKEIVTGYTSGYGVNYYAKKHKVDNCSIIRILTENGIKIRDQEEHYKQCSGVTVKLTQDTIKQKYGGWAAIHEMEKAANMKKYGVENSMQVKEHFYKQQESAHKLKETIIGGKIFKYQGYEAFAIEKLIARGYNVNDIVSTKGDVPQISYAFDGKRKKYYPDIFIPKDNLIVEVKSVWTYEKAITQNLAKQAAVLAQGYKFEFMIFDSKKNIVNLTP